ncbi:xanthine dehydrogenase family protein subunit M [Actinotalea sp.]|uniref:FAD binding domain-containing protein n=1 Tax=Actinotalea sp. TaxID=1872145 RepID=UPI0035628521
MVTYYKAQTLADALEMLGRADVQGSALSGGTDLLVALSRQHDETPRLVVDLKGIKDPRGPMVVSDDGLHLGFELTMAQLADDPTARSWFPALTQAAGEVGSVAIRNRATVVGNICNASPASDTAPPLLVHGATVTIASMGGERTVPISSFFRSPRVTACARGEIVTGIDIPRPIPGTGSAYRRLTRRWGVDLITVSVAAAVHGDGRVLLGLGAVAPTPLLVELPAGLDLTDRAGLTTALDEALAVATPITDIRGGADYRSAMLRELAERAIQEVLESTRRSSDGRSVRS